MEDYQISISKPLEPQILSTPQSANVWFHASHSSNERSKRPPQSDLCMVGDGGWKHFLLRLFGECRCRLLVRARGGSVDTWQQHLEIFVLKTLFLMRVAVAVEHGSPETPIQIAGPE